MTEASTGVLVVKDRPPPIVQSLLPGQPGTVSAYVALGLEGLLEAPEQATGTQAHPDGTFTRALLRYSGRAAFDLRIRTRPGQRPGVEIAFLIRTWALTADAAAVLAVRLREEVQQVLPPELLVTAITDVERIAQWLDPYGDEPVQAATVTKRELVALPTRSDRTAPLHLAVLPFEGRPEDWVPVYSALARSRLPMTMSLALFPVRVPAPWATELKRWVDDYRRQSEESDLPGGVYYSPSRLPADPFAGFAGRRLQIALASWSAGAAVARLQVTAPQLPVDFAELLGSAFAPAHLQGQAETSYEIRWLRGAKGSRTARWNLAALDCYPTRGRPEIWERLDVLPPRFRLLSVLVGVEEASTVLGLPTARAGGSALLPVHSTRVGGRRTRQVDVVVLTTTPIEASALNKALATAGAERREVAYGATNTYTLYQPVAGTLVAHVRCTMGTSAAGGSALTVAAALEDLRPWAVLAVGIAFGADVDKQPLNELLLSERLTAYELQRWGTDEAGGRASRDRGPTVPASPTLLGRFRDSHLEDAGIRVQAGQLLSGEKLVDNESHKADLLRRFPDAIGGEMEGAGLFAASHRASVQWLVVKAVCDHGQDKGTDMITRQLDAAEVAARAFAIILRQGGLRPQR